MQDLYKDFLGHERKYTGCNINYLFIFISASHVTLWPWVPLIFYYAGCTLIKIGLAIGLLQLLSILSVKLSLNRIGSTNSGSVRRLILFCLSILSFVFGMTALLLTPVPKSENICLPLQSTRLELSQQVYSNKLKPGASKDYSYSSEEGNLNTSNDTVLHTATSSDKLETNTNKSKLVFSEVLNNFSSNINHARHRPDILGKNPMENRNPNTMPPNYKETVFNKNNPIFYYRKNNWSSNPRITKNKYNYPNRLFKDYATKYDYKKDNFPKRYRPVNPFLQRGNIHRITNGNGGGVYNNRSYNIPFHSSKIPFRSNLNYEVEGNIRNDNDDFNSYVPVNVQSVDDNQNKFDHIIEKRSAEIFSSNVTEANIRSKHGINEFSTLVYGIAILLSLSVFFGGGFEIVINWLCHCCIYGAPDDNGPSGEMEYIVSPWLKLPFVGDHQVLSSCVSCVWLLFTAIAVIVACGAGWVVTPFKLLCVFFFTSESLKCITLLFIYMPYGDLCTSSLSRTLGLYLDNEVIEEGLRRISFHGWVAINGILFSLPYFYSIIVIIQEGQESQKEIWIAQTAAISALILGEAIFIVSNRWMAKNFSLQWLMVLPGVLVATQNLILWGFSSIWIKASSLLLVGVAKSILWLSVAINSQTLGTSDDQRKEAWISWACFKIGLGIGSIIWTSSADTEWSIYSIRNVLPISASFAILLSCIILLAVSVCRRRKNSKRIYHTLDLGDASDDETDESEVNLNDEDWLVKRAKKEGFRL